MTKKTSYAHDLLGMSQLAIDGVRGVVELVQAVHMNVLEKAIGQPFGVSIGKPFIAPVVGVTNFVYRSVHGVTNVVGSSLQHVLQPLLPLLNKEPESSGREALLAAVNGVLGDHLARSHNPLAIKMNFRVNGQVLVLEKAALAQRLPAANGRILILAHGLCMNDLQWHRNGQDFGALLQAQRGYTAIYLHYNTGRHIASNGQDLAHLLQELMENWPVPVEEITLLTHSMGGLLARSACHFAQQHQQTWLPKLKKMVFLGTPHQGAPLERGGNWVNLLLDVNTYSAPFSRLAKIRSAGITDLRHANLAADIPTDRFAATSAPLALLPLPPNVTCFAIAATLGEQVGDLADTLLAGDGLVPLASALGQHKEAALRLNFAPERQKIVYHTNHMQLLDSAEVAQQLLAWL